MRDDLAPRSRYVFAALLFLMGFALLGRASWSVFGSNWAAGRTQAALAAELSSEDPSLVFADRSLGSLGATGGGSLADLQPNPDQLAQAQPAGESLGAGSLAASVSGPRSAAPGSPTVSGALGRLRVPSIDLDVVFVSGVSLRELKKGPGWMPDTAAPGTAGNAVLSGHRTTYGAPFRHLDDLAIGDRIEVEVDGVTHVYEVRDSFVVAPGDVWVASPTQGVRLTLTTCHPEGSDRQRLVVQAELVEGPARAAATAAGAWARSQP